MYPLTDELIDFLLTDRARASMEEFSSMELTESSSLQALTTLRRQFTVPQAGVLLDQALLRKKASGKFQHPELMIFTEEALQQASSLEVASYRSQRFSGYAVVADLGCGIGGDTLALARVVTRVVAVEKDPLRARLAGINLTRLGVGAKVQLIPADWRYLRMKVDAAFVDPSRRRGARRVFRPDAMDPPLSSVLALRQQIEDVAVKLAPGIKEEEIPEDAEVEFISERGTCKEALLLFGGLRRGIMRTATLLPGPHSLDRSMIEEEEEEIRPPAKFIYEPDPAILRAKLVRGLASQLHAFQMDPTIAYLTSDLCMSTPFARVWRVTRHGAFNLKKLNQWLREAGAGDVVVKKRGSPIDPDAFRRRLKTCPEGETVTVFITRCDGQPWMVLAAPSDKPGSAH